MSVSNTNLNKTTRVWHNLQDGHSPQVLQHIAFLTYGFIHLDLDYVLKLQDTFRNRQQTTVFGSLPLWQTLDDAQLKKIIGHQGHFLKLTTTTQEIDFIWYDAHINQFLFWGPNKRSVVKAMEAIRWRVNKFSLPNETPIETPNETPSADDSMPELVSDDDTDDDLPDLI